MTIRSSDVREISQGVYAGKSLDREVVLNLDSSALSPR